MKQNELMTSVSGIRGIVGQNLNPEIVLRFAYGFGKLCIRNHGAKPKILIGRDSRITGKMLENAAIAGLMGSGCDVISLGILPTPSVGYNIKNSDAAGGIVITASHNPIEWNALKFYSCDGTFILKDDIKFLIEKSSTNEWENYNRIGNFREDHEAYRNHIEGILSSDIIDKGVIKQRGLRVVYDPGNGAGSKINKELLQKLGCEVIMINEEMNGIFSRNPEPVPENLSVLCKKVVENNADIGFATDPDADRLALIDEKGNAVGEEYSLVLSSMLFLKRMKSDIVTNLSSSRMLDDICSLNGVKLLRTPVGEANVVERMKRENVLFGGEGNGGIIYRNINPTRDASIGIALILNLLAEKDIKLSSMIETIPKYYMKKTRFNAQAEIIKERIDELMEVFAGSTVNKEDGYRFDWPDKWIHIRPSNTEPIIRIIGEARKEENLDFLLITAKKILEV
ncbi:MAG: phosphoglucosamine mutase [Candidatus Coatesbacteria bacterium]|nr:phosphoglucosamine mutase [Candidatus Coatesbacteria bacterium]